MKRLNFNIKDRKVLYMILAVVFVSVFSLTVAYAALSTILTISGRSDVIGSNWDIHFDNPVVMTGSANDDVPDITSPTTVSFSTILNMPGEFYEFTIDVVNDGSIDAMIENITKTPTLSTEQSKYLKYDITYQNGDSITNKQLVQSKNFVRLKVRVEFRSDLSNSDLPKTSETLNLGLKLDYIQSDGSGVSLPVHGVGNDDVNLIESYGSLEKVGTIVKIGTEYFYSLGVEGENVNLFAVYNLLVGKRRDSLLQYTFVNATGLQSSEARGLIFAANGYDATFPIIGVTEFSNSTNKGNKLSDYEGSVVEGYINDYVLKIEAMGVDVVSSGLLSDDNLENIFSCDMLENSCKDSPYSWVYSTAYWFGGDSGYDDSAYTMTSDGTFSNGIKCVESYFFGVRPVISVPVDDIIPPVLIDFFINDDTYQAKEGMTWGDWVDSKYNTAGFYRSSYGDMVYSSSGHDVRLNYTSVLVDDYINVNGKYSLDITGAAAPASGS